MTLRLLVTDNRIITQLRLNRSKWKLIKVDTIAAKDHMRRIGAMATMSTVRKRGMFIINLASSWCSKSVHQ